MSLDAEESLFIAIDASKNGDHETAIRLLKDAIELDKSNAYHHYMLAAEYATIGLLSRAEKPFEQTLLLMPELDSARIQYGLLLITTNQNEKAIDVLMDHALEREDTAVIPFRLFKDGLLALIKEDFEQAKNCILKGIENNDVNVALNEDFQKIVLQLNSMNEADDDASNQNQSFKLFHYQEQPL